MRLGYYLQTVRRWLWLIALITVVTVGMTYWFIQQQPPSYTADIKLTVGPSVDNPTSDLNALRASAQYLQTFSQLVETHPILQGVIDDLQLGRSTGNLAGAITVTPDVNTQVLTIKVTDTDRKRAVAIANSLGKVLVNYSNTNGGNSNGLDTATLQNQLEQKNLLSTQIEARIAQLEGQLADTQTALSSGEFAALQAKIAKLEASLATAVDPQLTKDIANRQAHIRELELGIRSTTNIQAQQLILNELTREDTRLAQDQATAKDQQRFVMDQLSEARNSLLALQTSNGQVANQIMSELAIQRNRQSDTQRAISDLHDALSKTSTNQVRVIDPAINASQEVSNDALNLLVAALGGLLLGLTVAFGLDFFQDLVHDPEDIKALGIALLGVIGGHRRLAGEGRNALIAAVEPESPAAQDLRVLTAKIISASTTESLRSLLVCSFDQGEDAAELVGNLALILTMFRERVVACDVSFRRPVLTHLFKLEHQQGMTDALWGKSNQSVAYLVPGIRGLAIVPSGMSTSNTLESFGLLRTFRDSELLEHSADIVLYAGSPLSSPADSLALASAVDGVVLVVRHDTMQRKRLMEATQTLLAVGANLLGVVLVQNHGAGIKVNMKTEKVGRDEIAQRRPENKSAPPTTTPEPKSVSGQRDVPAQTLQL
ncbi:MAG TPA: Wzz/FepE/Etk N-terminal domain-containing protein [Anaerolineae bacterium]|nr:Wzz/FepE/Etk N-terminal domain-containing protein [Anaerolineae bacterium]